MIHHYYYRTPEEFRELEAADALALTQARFVQTILNPEDAVNGSKVYRINPIGKIEAAYLRMQIESSGGHTGFAHIHGKLIFGKLVGDGRARKRKRYQYDIGGHERFVRGGDNPDIIQFAYNCSQTSPEDILSGMDPKLREKYNLLIAEQARAVGIDDVRSKIEQNEDPFYIPKFEDPPAWLIVRVPEDHEKNLCRILTHVFSPNFTPDPYAWRADYPDETPAE